VDAIHNPERTSYVFARNEIVALRKDHQPIQCTLPYEITGETVGD
jgi:hypothetical protein